MATKRTRGSRYPVEYVASELGLERKGLVRRLEAAGVHRNGAGVTFREAFEAWTAKSAQEADRARRQKAEADSAEIDAAEKRGDLMLKAKAVRWFADFGTYVRVQIMGMNVNESEKRKVCKTISEWEPDK